MFETKLVHLGYCSSVCRGCNYAREFYYGENSSPQGNDIYEFGNCIRKYSLFDSSQSIGSISGTNNVSADPLFVDADGADNSYGTLDDDLRLQSSSPAINQASDAVSDYPSTDINGLSRNGAPDIGAHELFCAPRYSVR